jgi:glucose/arabinose dehydrogenase
MKTSSTVRRHFFPAAVFFALAAGAHAQQTVPFARGVPVAPTGLEGQVLGAGPWTYKTAETMDITASVIARLEWPYSMAFLPTGEMLITTRKGELRMIRDGKLLPQTIAGGPAGVFRGKSGSLGAVHGYASLVVHPKFAQNGLIYFGVNKPQGEGYTGVVVRARLDGMKLVDVKELLAGEGLRGAIALAMTPDGLLWVAGGGDVAAQDPNVLAGKVLRLTDDGKPAPGNPIAGKPGHRPEIYTMGHRSALGLTVHPVTSDVYLAEMGPNGGDEINRLVAGKNYGWPLVSLGRTYPGPWQNKANIPTHEGYEPPIVYWTPSISVSGLTFYTGDKLSKWKGDLFVGGLRTGEVPGTGRLDRVLLNDKMEELRRETLFSDLHQRIRDVKQGPDGTLYVATDEEAGAILAVNPARAN